MSNYFDDMYYESILEEKAKTGTVNKIVTKTNKEYDDAFDSDLKDTRDIRDNLRKRGLTRAEYRAHNNIHPDLDEFSSLKSKIANAKRGYGQGDTSKPKASKSHIMAKRKGYTTQEAVVDLVFEAYKENVIDTDEVKMLLECTDLDVIIGYLDE